MTDIERIKIIRKSLNLNQEQFASSLGLTQGGYSDIERGKNNITNKTKLSLKKVYKINLHWLETGSGEMFAVDIEEENDEVNFFEVDQFEHLKREVEKLRNENLRLKTENRLYLELCTAKDKTIEILENQLLSGKKAGD
ncbi:MAG TPA: helix-turn-helix domain-containing protein [Aequorivita sp.]|nr:helix-turn-helix domain-containing protein [Aequorivita sp.]